MAKKMKVPVTMRGVIQRINRKLKPNLEMLKIARGERMRQQVGDYYVIDFRKNYVVATRVDPEQMAREINVLKDWERVEE